MKRICLLLFLLMSIFINVGYTKSISDIIDNKIKPVKFIVEDDLRKRLKDFLTGKIDNLNSILIKIEIDKEGISREFSIPELKKLNSKVYLPGLEIEKNISKSLMNNIVIDKDLLLRFTKEIIINVSSNNELTAEFKTELDRLSRKFFESLSVQNITIGYSISSMASEGASEFLPDMTSGESTESNYKVTIVVLLCLFLLGLFIAVLILSKGVKSSFAKLASQLEKSFTELSQNMNFPTEGQSAPVQQQDENYQSKNFQIVIDQENKSNDELKQLILGNKKLQGFIKKHAIEENYIGYFLVLKDILSADEYNDFIGKESVILEKEIITYLKNTPDFSNKNNIKELTDNLYNTCWYFTQSEEICIQKILNNKIISQPTDTIVKLIEILDETEMSLLISLVEPEYMAQLLTFNPELLDRFQKLDMEIKFSIKLLGSLNLKINNLLKVKDINNSYYEISDLLPNEIEKRFNMKSSLGDSFFDQLDEIQKTKLQNHLINLNVEQLKQVALGLPKEIMESVITKLPEMKAMRIKNSNLKITSETIKLKKELIDYVKKQS